MGQVFNAKAVEKARPGTDWVYFRGYLPTAPYDIAASLAWELYERGVVELVQKRLGYADYQYIAQKRRRVRHAKPV